jgi:hypothetical protein
MLYIILRNIFNPEVVDDEGEGDWSRGVRPKPRGVYTFRVTERSEFTAEAFVSENTRLR